MVSLVFNMTKSERIKGFYTALFKRYGSQGWWPAETELECILGTILTQNTSWKSVEKAIKIKNFIKFLNENYDGRLERMFKEDSKKLREKLLGIKGIGPETADSILLYAAKKPIFVVDAYTYRILSRHALIPEDSNYGEIQEIFLDLLPKDTQLFNEYHALLVKVGKEHCRKKPICEGCPLEFDPHTV